MVVFQFDNAYHSWAVLALQSLRLHEPCMRVLCNTANLSDCQVEELKAQGLTDVTNGAPGAHTTPERMAARKPFVMQNAMDRYPDEHSFALLDVDLLIRRPLEPLWSLMDTHPAALFFTDGYENGTFYPQLVTPSGIVLVRRDARSLVDCWAKWYFHEKPLGDIQPLTWFWDQITLAEAWKEAGLSCASIPMEIYSDDTLRPGSAIWHANVGDRKPRYYELFREEYERQLKSSAAYSRR